MSVAEDLLTVEDRVRAILVKFKATRDNDKLLWLAYNYAHNDLKGKIEAGDWNAFRAWIMNRNTPMFESLSRSRRKLQERFPELGGDKEKRLAIAEEVRVWSRT